MKTITIEGQLRTETGKTAARLLRSQDLVPGVIYGGEKEISFAVLASAIKPLVYTPNFYIAEVKLEGTSYRCIVKDLQFGKVSDKLIHVDMLELVDGKKVIANIPLSYEGTSIGVKNGGRFIAKMKSLKVKTLPKDLVEKIEVNIENLAIGENIRVSDVITKNMEIMNSPRIPIASVVITRALKTGEAGGDATAAAEVETEASEATTEA